MESQIGDETRIALDLGREHMRSAWHEFNAIRARDGSPAGVCDEWWSQMTDELGEMLADDKVPWMLKAARRHMDKLRRAEDERADLLAALTLLLYGAEKAVASGLNQPQINGGIVLARAAIAKAEGAN